MPEKLAFDFSSERPILTRADDLLDRSPFADKIAAAVRGWTGRDSLVLALYGDWGTGKSSIKNMVLDSLRASEQPFPGIIEFNPWQWAGQDQLSQAFFREVGKKLGLRDLSEHAKANAKRWNRYGAFMGLGTEVFGSVRRIALVGLATVSAVGFLGAFFPLTLIKIILGLICVLCLAGAVIPKAGGRFAVAVAAYFSAVAETEAKALAEIKSELSDSLKQLGQPVLVVMDDVDRLVGDQLSLLFQLVKANADFPNMVYLLLFQRETVEFTLTQEHGVNGRDYLEKIVQVGFDVPKLQRSKLERILFSKLNVFLEEKSVADLWDSERWPNLFVPGLGPYFETLRDVYRFVSALSLQFAVFSKKDSFEVNPIDLISLEVLRVFEPDVYKALPASKSILTNTITFAVHGHTREAEEKSEIESIIQKAVGPNKDRVEGILKNLFPPAAWAVGGSRYNNQYDDIWFRQHRVCHVDLFDKYFYLAIPEGDLSHEELEKIVNRASDREALVAELRSLARRDLLDVAMDRLESYKETISLDFSIPFVTGLFDVGDELPPGKVGMTEIPTELHAARIIYFYLKRVSTAKTRDEILFQSATETSGIYLLAFVTALEVDKVREGRTEDDRLTDDSGISRLKEVCIAKIRAAARDGILASHSRLGALLSMWREWASPEEVRAWVQSLIETRAGLFAFLQSCLGQSISQSIGSYAARTRWRMDLDAVESFVSIDVVERKLEGIPVKELDEKQKVAEEAFRRAIKRKREGKTSRSMLDED